MLELTEMFGKTTGSLDTVCSL